MITVFVKRIQNLPENEKQNIMGTLSGSALARLDKKKNEQLHLSSLCALSLLSNEHARVAFLSAICFQFW